MLTTKAEKLREFLSNKTPLNKDYKEFISEFREENVFSFLVNKENVDLDPLVKDLAELGFVVISQEKKDLSRIFFRIKEVQ